MSTAEPYRLTAIKAQPPASKAVAKQQAASTDIVFTTSILSTCQAFQANQQQKPPSGSDNRMNSIRIMAAA